jgi:hypothetical protein
VRLQSLMVGVSGRAEVLGLVPVCGVALAEATVRGGAGGFCGSRHRRLPVRRHASWHNEPPETAESLTAFV